MFLLLLVVGLPLRAHIISVSRFDVRIEKGAMVGLDLTAKTRQIREKVIAFDPGLSQAKFQSEEFWDGTFAYLNACIAMEIGGRSLEFRGEAAEFGGHQSALSLVLAEPVPLSGPLKIDLSCFTENGEHVVNEVSIPWEGKLHTYTFDQESSFIIFHP